jgi:hypothetical protein
MRIDDCQDRLGTMIGKPRLKTSGVSYQAHAPKLKEGMALDAINGEPVRENALFESRFVLKTKTVIFQDRLGINIGKAACKLEEKTAVCAGAGYEQGRDAQGDLGAAAAA